MQSVSGGEDAMAEATVRVSTEFESYQGRGTSTDTVLASARAYLDVINRIAKEKNAALVGTRQRILCEGPSKTNKERLSGRTSQNKIVIFDGDADRHTGELLDIDVEESTGFTLYGTACLEATTLA